ncbi:MAG TPA: hypothetical protein VKF35_13465 [Hyphomicrobiaceae bacterium]|nr:hypothetical protein [Hyphomicrobiaceae bacterium]
MRVERCLLPAAAGLLLLGAYGAPVEAASAQAASPVSLQRDGTIAVAGRTLKCGSVRNVLDPRLPNLGIASPGVLVMNPRLLTRQPETVRLFVFHHECGHHHVGGNELKADCWAVGEGVRQGWLDRKGLTQVCRSFGDAPTTATHPSGRDRCSNLDRCFAAATQRQQTAAASAAAKSPKLTAGPTLVRPGVVPDAEGPAFRAKAAP